MINCNPETVSTDYDTSDRLYFEPLTDEDVISIIKREAENGDLRGVIVQLGGQTPLKIAAALEAEGIPILGTSPDAIDLAEDRERFQLLLKSLIVLNLKMALPTRLKKPAKLFRELAYQSLFVRHMCLAGALWKLSPKRMI